MRLTHTQTWLSLLMQAVTNDVTQKKAKLLYLLARAENIRTSRDELTDMLAANSLTEELQKIWDTKGAEQLDIVRLNKAASRGEEEELRVGCTLAGISILGGYVAGVYYLSLQDSTI